jgi:cytochrome c oxidase cbb3-type subunit 1
VSSVWFRGYLWGVMGLSKWHSIQGLPFIQSVIDMGPYGLWGSIGGGLMFLSRLVFAWNVWVMTFRRARAGAPGPALASGAAA